MEPKELICIVCPRGCQLTVTKDQEGSYTVCGNFCNRGVLYGVDEVCHPVRYVTTTVKIEGSIYPRLPVITDKQVAKHLIFQVMDEINKVSVKAPIQYGDIIIKDLLNTGVNVIASRSMVQV